MHSAFNLENIFISKLYFQFLMDDNIEDSRKGSCDVAIIGAGAAGLTAAIYTRRKFLSTKIISMDCGGQTNLAGVIENYPAILGCKGSELMQKFLEHALSFGAELVSGKSVNIEKTGNGFLVHLSDGSAIHTKAVIVASGRIPRLMGVPNEENLIGNGISTCVTCDGPMFKNKKVAVYGAGPAAAHAAFELAGIASEVTLITKMPKLTSPEDINKKLEAMDNVKIIANHVPVGVHGTSHVKGIEIKNNESGQTETIGVDGVFVQLGYTMDTSFAKGIANMNEKNEIIVDDRCNTSCHGLLACGDVTQSPFKQTVISAGEGAKAGLEAHRYITGGKGVSIDWVH